MPNFIKCTGYVEKYAPKSLVGASSNAVYISCNIDSSWAMQESPGRKPDWEDVKSLFCKK